MQIVCNMIEAHIFRKKKDNIEFLLLKRSEKIIYPNLWQMVNGKIKEGEKAYETALREIKEETGIIPKHLWTAPNVNPFYSHEKDTLCLLPVFAAEADADSKVQISDEHTEYKWVSPDEAVKALAWDAQRRSVRLITSYFLNEKTFLNLLEINI